MNSYRNFHDSESLKFARNHLNHVTSRNELTQLIHGGNIMLRSDQERTIQEVYNSVPFVLQHGGYHIEVVDALAAEVLDMDTISDYFEPSVPTLTDHLWGFFTGTACMLAPPSSQIFLSINNKEALVF